MIDAILFDKDGTLVDLHATWLPTYRAATDRLAAAAGDPSLSDRLMIAGGWLPSENRLRPGSPLSCATNDEIIDLWLTDPVAAGVPAARALARETFLAEAVRHTTPVVPLRPYLEALRARGLRLGIATMDSTAAARASMDAVGALDLFDLILGFDAGVRPKPEPDMVYAFCDAVGVPAGRTALVGDARKDLETGRRAGVGLRVGVLTGAAGRDELAPWADVVLDSIAELPAVLDGRG